MAAGSVIIIGAGLGGLSAGCYCQMNGYRTRIFEHRPVPGGVAATWERDGYRIDAGIHFLTGYQPGSDLYGIYRELGVAGNGDRRALDVPASIRYRDELSGRSVTVGVGLKQLEADLSELFPGDVAVVRGLAAAVRSLQSAHVNTAELSRPAELPSGLHGFKQAWELRKLARYLGGPYREPVSRFVSRIKDPFFRFVLENLFLPDVPVWFVLLLLAYLTRGDVVLPGTASLDFARAIERCYLDLGGEVTYNTSVREIMVERRRAVGVRLMDGREYRADVVISAADGYSTIFQLLGGRYVDAKIRERYERWKLFPPLMMVGLGVDRDMRGESPLTFYRLRSPFSTAGVSSDSMFVRLLNYSPAFAPAGKTAIQVEAYADWDHWSRLHDTSIRLYDEQKEMFAQEVIRKLDRLYPGLSDLIETSACASPYSTWRRTRNYKGAWEGFQPTTEALMGRVERKLPGLDGFFMAGQWVTPGGGVGPTLYSGRYVAEILCYRDRKPFRTAAK